MDNIQFALKLAFFVSIYFLCPSHQQTAAPNNKCMEDFANALTGCVKDAGLGFGNFIWFTTNGTSPKAEKPANEDDFKKQICGVQQQVGACALQRVGAVVNTTSCMGTSASTTQVETITRQLQAIFGTYDLKCMNPCRNTLIPDLQKCYTGNGVDAKLFASNSSSGAAIGSTEVETSKFCGAKDKVIGCMKEKSDACPESPTILAAIGLNYTTFIKMTDMLCAHVKTYLTGLSCFAETTSDVQVCQQKQTQSLTQLTVQASQGNWTEERYFSYYCEAAVDNIDCDISAWAKKNHEACIPAVIDLRRSLECDFLAPQCKSNVKLMEKPDNVCRGRMSASSSSTLAQAFLLVFSLMIMALAMN